MIRVGTFCSGIGAPDVAMRALANWQPVFFSEIEPFPCAVLKHHWPEVPNIGDMTAVDGTVWRGKVDVIIAGTPCQAFSVAGMRKGLEDARGNLTLKLVELVDAIKPSCLLWENVPGVLSDKGNAFGCFLAGLAGEDVPLLPPGGRWSDAGYVLGPQRAIAWRVLDAQYFGVAQRRRRVFLVACPRDGADPRAVLFESEGVRRDTPPCRETGEGAAGNAACRSHWSGGAHPSLSQSNNQELFGQQGAYLVPGHVCPTLRAGGNQTGGDRPPGTDVDTADSLIPVCHYGDQADTLTARHDSSPCADRGMNVVAFQQNQLGEVRTGEVAGTLNTNCNPSGRNTPMVVRSIHENQRAEITINDTCGAIKCAGGKPGQGYPAVHVGMQVRRLTPVECERLQGFPEGYTNIPWRNKPASDCPDGPRYKALGNSMAVPCIRWIIERINKELTL